MKKINNVSKIISIIAGRSGVSGSTDGPFGTGTLTEPQEMSIDEKKELIYFIRKLIFTVENNGPIRSVDKDGTLRTIIIDYNSPLSITVDGNGNIYYTTSQWVIYYNVASLIITEVGGFDSAVGISYDPTTGSVFVVFKN